MRDVLPLTGETVIFTGTKKSHEAFELVETYGGTPFHAPLIETSELIAADDQACLRAADAYDWVIFTSQSAVRSFGAKMEREGMRADRFSSKIAAVGTKTAEALDRLGFHVSFIPTRFSADTFVQEFKPDGGRKLDVLFIRGTLAGSLIREELPFSVDEWTVYKTEPCLDSIGRLIPKITSGEPVSVLFASPSAVRVFAEHVAPQAGFTGYTIGAIGHVTEKALLEEGAAVHAMPDTYTLPELVNALAKTKG